MRRAIAALAGAFLVVGCTSGGPAWTLGPGATAGGPAPTVAPPATPAPSAPPTSSPTIGGLAGLGQLSGGDGIGVPGGVAAATDAVTETWYDGTFETHYFYNGCVIIGEPYTAILSQEYAGFRTNGGVAPKVGDVYWAHLYFLVFTNPCTAGADVATEVSLPAGTSFALGSGYPGYSIHCWYYPAGGGSPVEVTNDPNAGCTQTPGAGTYGSSLGGRIVANGAGFEIQFPLVSTKELAGMADNTSKLTTYLYESIATNPLTAPYQWVTVSANPPSIGYPSPSTTGIAATTAHSVANVYNHYAAGNAYFDIGTTTAYGTTDGPVAIASSYNTAQVYDDWSGLAPNTTYHWRVRFVTSGGTYTGADQVFTTAADTTKPVARPPTAAFVVGAALGTTAVPVRISWLAATDDVSSGSSLQYELGERTYSGGAWSAWSTVIPWTTSRVATRSLTPGSDSHQFRDRAKDAAGNVGSYATGTSFRLTAYQENSGTVVYGGTWTRTAVASAYGGYAKWSAGAGAKATFSFTGRAVALVAPKGPDLGKADVYVDGAKVATVDLYASSSLPRRIVWTKAWASSAAHSVEVRVLGTKNAASSGTKFWVDAFATLR